MLISFAVGFALLALFCALQAVSSLEPYRRVLRQPTQSIASLASGPAEVAGTLLARASAGGPPCATLDGQPAIAVRTTVRYSYRAGSKVYAGGALLDEVEAAEAEIRDASGTCTVDTTSLLLLGVRKTSSHAAGSFKERHPALWARIPFPEEHTVVRVEIDETFVPEGAVGMVSGEAEAEGTVPGDDYRGARMRFRITGSVDRPLILSAFPEATSRQMLLRPVWMFAALAGLSLAAASAVVVAQRMIGE